MADVAERLAGLSDLRLPALEVEALIADAAAAFAAGLLLAALVALAARLVLKPLPSRRQRLLAELAETRRLPAEERLFAQATLLRCLADEAETTAAEDAAGDDWLARLDLRLRTDFFTAGPGADLRQALYRRSPPSAPAGPDDYPLGPERLEREVTRLLRRARL